LAGLRKECGFGRQVLQKIRREVTTTDRSTYDISERTEGLFSGKLQCPVESLAMEGLGEEPGVEVVALLVVLVDSLVVTEVTWEYTG
jgi:hypothetical protein